MIGYRPSPANGVARRALALLLTVPPLLANVPAAPAQSPVTAEPAQALSLDASLQLAFQNQPRLGAWRASLAAAEDGRRALDNLNVPGLLVPELPIRRRQACLGVTAASAGLDQAQRETTYAVTRTYFTVIYARQQESVARAIVERLKATRDTAKQAVDAGSLEATANDVKRASVYVRLAETKRLQASEGVKRALSALKEAIGLGPNTCVEVPDGRLPEATARPCREDVVAQAIARRGDLVRAVVFADVTCLEVEAQATAAHKRKMETFAAGSDIHAVPVPLGTHNGDYKPGALPPEMPDLLVGSRSDRVKRAQSLHARARAVVDVTRNLITLEADDAYLRWEEASLQAAEARVAAETGEQLANDISNDYRSGLKVKVEDVINSHVLASQARSQYNEALYRQILALADLERITAGGFCAGLVEGAAAPPVSGHAVKSR
jgi:hypothetical protein